MAENQGTLEARYAQITGSYPLQPELCSYRRAVGPGGDYCVQQTCEYAPGLVTTTTNCTSGRGQRFVAYPDGSGEFYDRPPSPGPRPYFWFQPPLPPLVGRRHPWGGPRRRAGVRRGPTPYWW